MSNITPGPWRIGDAGCTVFGPKTDSPSPVTVAVVTARTAPTDQQRANARAIAALPEMLDLLTRMQGFSDHTSRRNTETVQAEVQALLRKAGAL